MAELHEIGVAESARRIRGGKLSPTDLLMACLARIEKVDRVVKAWVHVDRDAALRVAKERQVAPWSSAGMPSIALPSGVDPAGLPLSVQLVGGSFAESRLLGAARWCEGILAFAAAPGL